MRLVLLDSVPLAPQHLAELRELADTTVYNDRPKAVDEIIRRMAGADAITTFGVDISAGIIAASPALRYIYVLAVGHDNVDGTAARSSGVSVINCPTHNYIAVAQHALGLMLAVTRKIVPANLAARQGRWRGVSYEGPELMGKTLGLIGYGNIGKELARYARCLGMTVQHANSRTQASGLDRLVATSDIVCLCLPLTAATRHMMDERRLGLMKAGAYLINPARGPLVDTRALLTALRAGRLAGAALDVVEGEPFRSGIDPQTQALLAQDNVVATPHIAADTPEVMVRLGSELIQNVKACLLGQPIHVVN
jgi:phosphoglycerate dehydrogenase-like enzyme